MGSRVHREPYIPRVGRIGPTYGLVVVGRGYAPDNRRITGSGVHREPYISRVGRVGRVGPTYGLVVVGRGYAPDAA